MSRPSHPLSRRSAVRGMIGFCPPGEQTRLIRPRPPQDDCKVAIFLLDSGPSFPRKRESIGDYTANLDIRNTLLDPRPLEELIS